MPRKINPHLNEQSEVLPTDVIENYKMPVGVLRLLPEDLAPEKRTAALNSIQEALGEYAWEYEAGPYRYRRAEVSEGLRGLLKKGEFDHKALYALNQGAFNILYDCLALDSAQQWMLIGGEVEPRAAEFEQAAKQAISLLYTQGGPEKPVTLAYLVPRLCHVYEAMTGKKVTHHTKAADLSYTQQAQSEAGRFVTAIINLAFEDIPDTLVNRQLREFVKNRPEPF